MLKTAKQMVMKMLGSDESAEVQCQFWLLDKDVRFNVSEIFVYLQSLFPCLKFFFSNTASTF